MVESYGYYKVDSFLVRFLVCSCGVAHTTRESSYRLTMDCT